jgi:hypothetical protein
MSTGTFTILHSTIFPFQPAFWHRGPSFWHVAGRILHLDGHIDYFTLYYFSFPAYFLASRAVMLTCRTARCDGQIYYLFYNVGEKRQARCAEKTKAEAKR